MRVPHGAFLFLQTARFTVYRLSSCRRQPWQAEASWLPVPASSGAEGAAAAPVEDAAAVVLAADVAAAPERGADRASLLPAQLAQDPRERRVVPWPGCRPGPLVGSGVGVSTGCAGSGRTTPGAFTGPPRIGAGSSTVSGGCCTGRIGCVGRVGCGVTGAVGCGAAGCVGPTGRPCPGWRPGPLPLVPPTGAVGAGCCTGVGLSIGAVGRAGPGRTGLCSTGLWFTGF